MKTVITSRIAAVAMASLVVISLSSCSNKTDDTNSSNSQNSPSASTTTSPSETTSPSSSTSPTAQTKGVAPQGTNCPSGNPIKAVTSKKLGKIALTTKSPSYSKTKPEKCFADTASAQQAGYKVPK